MGQGICMLTISTQHDSVILFIDYCLKHITAVLSLLTVSPSSLIRLLQNGSVLNFTASMQDVSEIDNLVPLPSGIYQYGFRMWVMFILFGTVGLTQFSTSFQTQKNLIFHLDFFLFFLRLIIISLQNSYNA